MSESEVPSCEVEIASSPDGGNRVPDLTPREALERWLNKLRVSKSESTVSAYQYRLKHFVEWAEDEQIETVSELTGWDIESYETVRRQQELKPISLNNELGTLKSFFEYCARIEVANEDLPEKVDVPDVDTSDQVSDARLTTDEAQELLKYYETASKDCGSRSHALLATAWYTGARLGALRGLDVRDYDKEERCLQFMHRPNKSTPLKNGTDGERIVGLPEQVCTVLEEYIRTNRHDKYDDYGRQPLFASEVGRASTNAVRAWMYFATVPCLHSGCPHGNDRPTCEYLDYSSISKCPSSVNPHAVRTGSITWQLNRGIPPERVSERVNTSIDVLLRHYDQQSRMEELRERRRPFLDRLTFSDKEGEGK